MDDDDLIDSQIEYYRARAPEFDRWWQHTDLYVLDPDAQAAWDREVAALDTWFTGLGIGGDVLEVACGTGIWTSRLIQVAARVTAVDASPEMLAINAARHPSVTFVEGDVLGGLPGGWRPAERYDAVFFSFWLTHVPPSHAAAFWDLVAGALKPGGRAVFVDNLWRPGGWPPERPSSYVQPRYDLSDGRQFDIVKRYYEPDELAGELDALGWTASVSATDTYFLMGSASPGTPTPPG